MSSVAVLIELAVSERTSPYASVLAEACSEGLRGGGECALAPSGTEAPAVAVVSWHDAGHLSVRIEVGVRRAGRGDWLTRDATFGSSDAESERWRAVGLVIATLVGEGRSPSPVTPSPPSPPALPALAEMPPAESSVPETPPSGRSAPALTRWSLRLGIEASRGSAQTIGAAGGSLSADRRLGMSAGFATCSLRYEAQPHAVPAIDLDWAWGGCGLGVAAAIPSTGVVVDVRLEPSVAWLRARLTAGGGDQRSSVVLGAREGVEATYWLGSWLGVSVGGEVFETAGREVVRLSRGDSAPAPQVTVEPIGWASSLGVRVRTN